MRFAILGSGSGGNCAIIQSQQTTLMLDCGFTIKECSKRLQQLELAPESINAIVVTHEHGDHYNGVGPFSRRFKIPVYMTHGSWLPHRCGELADLNLITPHIPFTIGDIEITPFPVPHDAREPCQYRFGNENQHLGFLTDTGQLTSHIEATLSGCDALVVEFNHDMEMLANGPYPPTLQSRIAGSKGHLNNQQSEQIIRKLLHPALKHLVAAHLSEKNNHSDLVDSILYRLVAETLCKITIAEQHSVTPWIEID